MVGTQTALEQLYAQNDDRALRAARARREFLVTVAGLIDVRGYRDAGEFTKTELRTLAGEAARRNGLTLEGAFKNWTPWA